MNLTLRRRLLIAGIFLVLVLAGAWLLTRRSSGELDRWKAAQRARGEKFTLAEIAPPVSEARRAWESSLSDAANGLDRTPAGIELKRPAGPGTANAAWQSADPFNGKLPVDGWPPFLEAMQANESSLAKIRALLLAAPPGSIHDRDAPFDSTLGVNFVARRTAAQILAAGVVAELHQEHLDLALTNLHALLALAGVRDEGGWLVDHMIQSAIGGLGLAATWEAMVAPGWDEPRLAALQSAWERTDLLTNFHRTAELERAFVVMFIMEARTNRAGLRRIFAAGGSATGTSLGEDIRDSLFSTIWRSAWADEDELHILKAMQPIVDGLRTTITNADYGNFRRALTQSRALLTAHPGKLAQLRQSFASVASATIPNWEKSSLSLWKQETQRRLAVIAVALRRYQFRHGRLPESLSALVPEFLVKVPADPLSGQPWHYRQATDGAFVLYSAGENGIHEDASGDDLAWPRPMVPEDR